MKSPPVERVSYWFLCAVPFLAVALVGVHALRIYGVHQAIGIAVFAAISVAVWMLGARAVGAGPEGARSLAVTGALLLTPFTLVSLLWVGIATPWDATPAENLMRYLVLLAGAVAVTGGFVVLKELVSDAGERLYASLGFGAGMLAGAAYVVWLTDQVHAWSVRVHAGDLPSAVVSPGGGSDTLLFVACALTYLTTAAFAASLGRTRWIGRRASQVFVVLNAVALVLLGMRGLAFPDPTAGTTPWYTRPGFIAGIPAVPWIMPHLLARCCLLRGAESSDVALTRRVGIPSYTLAATRTAPMRRAR